MKKEIKPWQYKGKDFTLLESHNYEGFVYVITHIPSGRKYLGKKSFWSRRKATKSAKRKTTMPSDWERYFSSSSDIKDFIKEFGKEDWKREILVLCASAKWMNYFEVKYQFELSVLESDDWLNSNINGLWFGRNYRNHKPNDYEFDIQLLEGFNH